MENVEQNMSFLEMEGQEQDVPMMVDPIEEMATQQLDEIMSRVVARFEGGEEEIKQLIEDDKKDITEYKKNVSDFNNLDQVFNLEDSSDQTEFIASSVPGASLTGNMLDDEKGTIGKYPWETPPELPSPLEAFNYIIIKKNEEPRKTNIVKILSAGAPAESLARVITFKGFLEGMFMPDVEELIVVPIMLDLVADAQDAGVKPRILNDFNDDNIDDRTVFDMMKNMHPEKFKIIEEEAAILNRMPEEMPMDMSMPIPEGSFLDMEEEQ